MRSRSDLAILGWVMLALGCPEAPAPVPPPPPPVAVVVDAGAPQAEESERLPALVLNLSGAVEVLRKGSTEWISLAVGDPVQVGDKVRMAADGQLELSFDVAQIKMHEGSDLELTLLDPREVRLEVTGTVEVEVPGGEASISGGGHVARSRGGRVSFSYDGRTATAGALAGGASLTSHGQTVALGEGEFAMTRDTGLTRAAKMPRTFTLEVAWPPGTETNQPGLSIRGKVSGRARVVVGGRRVEPAADGSFEGKVALRPGRQTVIVSASDSFGRRSAKAHQYVLDPAALKIKGAVEYH